MQNGQNIKLIFFDSTVGNSFNEKGFSFCKAKTKLFLTKKHKKICVQCFKKRLHWRNNEWRKVVFSDKSRFCQN